jgi:PAS domain S-box-containing protein
MNALPKRRQTRKPPGRRPRPPAAPRRPIEAELRRANRALRTLSSCNQALVHATNEPALLAEVCRVMVEESGFRLAWVGYAENDAKKSVRPIAHAGFAAGYLEAAGITWADTERGRGPTGTAIRTGQPAVCRNVLVDPNFRPWRADAVRRGYASSVVLPLAADGAVFGALNIYAVEPDAFDANEVKLLAEMADDLAFGIMALRERAARREAEEALRRREAELREAQRVARVGSWWMDSATNEVTWTEELYRMLGLDPASSPPPYPEHHRLFTPESWRRLSAALPRTQETGVPYELELEMVRPDGGTGWMLARGEPVRDAQGVIVGLRGIAQDITERKRAEAALQESEQSFRTLAESVPQIVWATRADGWNIYFNRHWVDYTGMTLEESCGHGWNIPFHPDDRQRAWQAWQRATQEGATYSLEVRLRRADGIYRWWLVRGAPLRDAAGNTVKWFGTCTDIHDLKEAEAEIRRLNSDLERRVIERTAALETANKELEAFAYSVSHDLRAPLRSIDGFSRILLEDYRAALDDEGKDSLIRVRAATQRMGQLIDDLLTLSRAARTEMRRGPVDLTALAGEIAADLQGAEPERSVRWTVAPGLVATGDRELLRLVLFNLLSNAWKFTGPQADASIEVGTMPTERGPAFFVRDNGVGFDMAYAGRLFGAFQRLHATAEFPGTGIGLATVQRIIHRHGGRLWAEGAVGRGATFHFTLPER